MKCSINNENSEVFATLTLKPVISGCELHLAKIQAETGHNPAVTSLCVIRQALEERDYPVPPADL